MKNRIIFSIASAVLLALFFGQSHGVEANEEDKPILPTAHFGQKDLQPGFEVLVGRLFLHRQFQGTRANPTHYDSARFHFFDGSELKFLTLTDEQLDQPVLDQLRAGQSVPVVLTANFESVRVGHDGINVSERLVPRVQTCVPISVELVCAAANDAGFDQAACDAFAKAVKPDASQNGVAVSLGQVMVRPKILPRWKTSTVAIHGIRVFNTTAEIATIEIVGLTIEQGGVSQQCPLDEQVSLRAWPVQAESWSDGVYTPGQMPKTRWAFEPTKPIDPEQQVTVHLEIKINGGKKVAITRTVEPMSLKK